MDKRICLILSLSYILIHYPAIGQTAVQTGGKDSRLFDKFLELFSNINDTSNALQQEIAMNHYQNYIEIDSIYDSFIHRIPFFTYYATFKVTKQNGVVVCVYGRYASRYTMLSYIEINVYSFDGMIQETKRLPFIDYSLYPDKTVGFELCDLYVSSKVIVYNYNSYRSPRGQSLKKIIFNIENDGKLTEQ